MLQFRPAQETIVESVSLHMSTLWRAKDSLPLVVMACLLALLLLDENFRNSRVSIILVSLVGVACALKTPRMAGLFFCVIFLCLCYDGEARNIVTVLGAIGVVGIISYHGYLYSSISIGFFLFYIGSTEIFEGKFLPKALDGAVVLALLTIGAIIVGFIGEKKKRQLLEDKKKAKEALQLHREAAVRTLHDSVAGTLTSSILRAESLALEPGLNPEIKDTIQLISEENRKAMAEVRTLIRLMNDDEAIIAEYQLQQALSKQISEFKELLESHEFKVRTTTKNLTLERLSAIPSLSMPIMSELAANIIKYGVPHSAVDLELVATPDGLRITTRNDIAPAQSSSVLSTGLGLKEIESRAAEHGGRFTYGVKHDQWETVWEITPQVGTKVPNLNNFRSPTKKTLKEKAE